MIVDELHIFIVLDLIVVGLVFVAFVEVDDLDLLLILMILIS
jgi:hypothetical protein